MATKDCCAWCSDPALWTDRDKMVWIGPKQFVCDYCAQLEQVKVYLEG